MQDFRPRALLVSCALSLAVSMALLPSSAGAAELKKIGSTPAPKGSTPKPAATPAATPASKAAATPAPKSVAEPVPAPVPTTEPGAVNTDPVSPEDMDALRAALGTKVMVEGTPVRAGESKSKTVRFLDFGTAIGKALSLVFMEGKGETVTLEEVQSYVGKKVRVTGVISEYKERLQMQVDAKSQIVEVPAE